MLKLLKKLLLLCVLLAAGIGIWTALDGGGETTKYRTVPITRGSIADVVTANGALNPMDLVMVGTQVSGQVSQVYVKLNDEVKKGQLLAEIDPALLEADLKQTRSAMETARITYEQSARDLERTRMLVNKDYLPKVDLEHAQQNYLSSKNSYESAKSAVERGEVNLNYTKIFSPIDGVVISQDVTLGQTVAASYQTPNLFKIAGDLTKMKIDVNFSESDISKVKQGMKVKFTVDAFPDKDFDGVVDVVNMNPKTEQGVVTYSVTVSVDNKEKLLLPGMTAYISLTLSEIKDVLRVPPSALRFTPPAEQTGGLQALFQPGMRGMRIPRGAAVNADPTKGTIYVLKNGKPKMITVELGKSDESNVAVTSPEIQENDEVIIGLATSMKR
jgi:HlyD family secretion protein